MYSISRSVSPWEVYNKERYVLVLTKHGKYINRSTILALIDDEKACPLEEEERMQFDIVVKEKLGDYYEQTDDSDEKLNIDTPHLPPYEDGEEGPLPIPERDDLADDHYDQYINSEVLLPIQGESTRQVNLLVTSVTAMETWLNNLTRVQSVIPGNTWYSFLMELKLNIRQIL